MRIAVTMPTRQAIGGAELWVRALVPELVARGHELLLVSEYSAPSGQAAVGDGVPGLPAVCSAELGHEALLAGIRRWGPDVVFSQGLRDPTLEATLVERFPAVLFAHGYYGTCVAGTKWHAFPRYTACGRRMSTWCLPVNYLRRCGGLSPATLLREYARQRRLASLLPKYSGIVVASRFMRDEFLRHGVAASKLHLAPLAPPGGAVDPDPPSRRPASGRIAFVGRLYRPKGVALLIVATARAGARLGRRLQLEIMGDGPERERLGRVALRAGVDARFAGWVTADARDEILRTCDLLGVPSLGPETFGLVGIEAGRVGVPAAGFAHGGVTDWLLPGVSGELAPASPATAEGLSEAIVRALRDPDHHAALRRGAWQVARSFTMRRHLEILEPALARVAADQSRRAPSGLHR